MNLFWKLVPITLSRDFSRADRQTNHLLISHAASNHAKNHALLLLIVLLLQQSTFDIDIHGIILNSGRVVVLMVIQQLSQLNVFTITTYNVLLDDDDDDDAIMKKTAEYMEFIVHHFYYSYMKQWK